MTEATRQGRGGPSRRGFIGLLVLGYATLAAWLGGALLGFIRFLYPNAIYEAPQRFKVGKPADYPADSITYITGRRVWIGNYPQGLAAVIAVCTHLGCKPNWHPEQRSEAFGKGIFECPCHGSKFDRYARNFAGPAPFPLWRATLTLEPDGRLLVDKTTKLGPRVRVVDGVESDETKALEFFFRPEGLAAVMQQQGEAT